MKQVFLSPYEKRFLRRLAAGKTDAEIAAHLGGSIKRVSEQRVRLLRKLGISEAPQIAEAADRLARYGTYRGVT
ncbi:hypothetical protein JQ543_28135 [Bradyrhizobium diazoefficiens]|nr:hypothetical protein [Bradyrhizobium diazoefficiens]MBR0851642.1 hypothetical protein [Bradyrhizobium diazoefficiens]